MDPAAQPNGGTWEFAYTTAGSLVTETRVTDPRGFVTAYGIDTGYIASVTNVSLGQTTTFIRDPATRHITRIVDPLGRTIDLRYDVKKNVDRITRWTPRPTRNPASTSSPTTPPGTTC